MKSVLTTSILLAILTFSLAVDTPNSASNEQILTSSSEKKVMAFHPFSTTKDSLKFIQQLADDITFDIFDENKSNDTLQSELEGRGNKKEDKMMQSMYMAMMMSKAFFSIVFMFVNQIFQLKSFGFSLLNAIINLGRFIIQYQQHVANQQKNQVVKVQAQDWAVGSTGYGYGNSYQYYQPSSYSSSNSGTAADRVTRMASSQSANNNLHANNLAYAAYSPANNGART